MSMNLGLINEALAAAYPDRVAIITPARRVTYAQLAERSRRLANLLRTHGITVQRERSALRNHESGQSHVGLYMYNCPEYIEGMLGCMKARAASFNVNYRYVEDELLYLFIDADAEAVIYQSRFAPTLARIRSRLPKLRLLLQIKDDSSEALLPGALDYDAALASAQSTMPSARPSPDDLYILYTGGTTGAPKGVLWRQADIFCAAMNGRAPGAPLPETIEQLVAAAADGERLRILPTPPLMHGAAQWMAFGAFHQGGTVVLQGKPERIDADDVWSTIEREQVSFMALVGDAFARPLLDGLSRRDYDLSRLFVIGSGGAILSQHYKEALLEKIPHAMIVDAFGASETGAQGNHVSRKGEQTTTGSFAMTNTFVMREDLSGLIEPGSAEKGLVAGRGHVPLGYYKDAAKTALTFPVVDGTRYAVPGDHAHYASDGRITVLGRGAVSINTGGEKVYPEEVEQALRRHPKVYDAVVVGTPDERFGEQVTAVVQPRPGERPSNQELVEFAAAHLARYKLPKTTVLVEQMVRSPSGKPDYRWAKATAMAARGLST